MRKIDVIPLIGIPLLGAALVMAGESTHPLANAKSGQWVLVMESRGAETLKPADTPKGEIPKAEAPKADTPKAEAPKAETPKAEAPKADAAKEQFFYKWIAKVDKKSVYLKAQSVTKDGNFGLGEAQETVVNLDTPAEEPVASATTDEEILFKDKKLKCKKIESVHMDPKLGKITTTKWISDEVPIYGIVRSISVDKDKKELSRTDLLDFGMTGGSARPMEKKN